MNVMRVVRWRDIYGRGRVLDVWSFPHFYFGVVIALVADTFGVGVWPAFFGTLVLALLWELIESWLHIVENPWNVVADCALPLIALLFTHDLYATLAFNEEQRGVLLVVAVLVYLIMNYMAWEARFKGEREFLG